MGAPGVGGRVTLVLGPVAVLGRTLLVAEGRGQVGGAFVCGGVRVMRGGAPVAGLLGTLA